MAFYSKFADYYPYIFPLNSTAFTFLHDYVPDNGGRLLDVGCGTGHYAEEFAKNGFQATGIDVDAEMIRYAREHYHHATFENVDMLEIDRLDGPFDLIFSLGNVVAHLSPEELDRFLGKVATKLTANGTWIFQVLNWDYLLKQETYTFPVLQAFDGRVKFYRQYPVIQKEELTFKTWLYDDEELVFEDSVSLYPLTSKEYTSCHEKHRMTPTGHYADFVKNNYKENKDSANIFVFKPQK